MASHIGSTRTSLWQSLDSSRPIHCKSASSLTLRHCRSICSSDGAYAPQQAHCRGPSKLCQDAIRRARTPAAARPFATYPFFRSGCCTDSSGCRADDRLTIARSCKFNARRANQRGRPKTLTRSELSGVAARISNFSSCDELVDGQVDVGTCQSATPRRCRQKSPTANDGPSHPWGCCKEARLLGSTGIDKASASSASESTWTAEDINTCSDKETPCKG